MKILLTGATGFIGKHVYNTLISTYNDIHVISRKPPLNKYWYQADILKNEEINRIVQDVRADVLIHLAWDVTHGGFWNGFHNEAYAEASKFLFNRFIINGGKKIIAAGSCAEYPASPEAVTEDVVYEGELMPYGKAKKSVYNYLNSRQKQLLFDFTWLRIFGIYGPGENEERFFPKAIQSIRSKIPFDIKNPDCFVDYVYVKDIANFIKWSIDQKELGAINIGTGYSVSLANLYNILQAYIERGDYIPTQNISKPDISSRIPDCGKLEKHGFNFNLEQGFENMFSNELNR